jgi:soluble lytic murein transglycosylase
MRKQQRKKCCAIGTACAMQTTAARSLRQLCSKPSKSQRWMYGKRLSIEGNRARAAANAVTIVSPESAAAIAEINANPARYLASRMIAAGNTRKELVTLALIKMATNDAEAAAGALEAKWGVQLSAEERSWVWGVIGKQANLKLSSEAGEYFSKARNEHLNDDLLGWKARAALRATSAAQGWPVVLAAINAMSEEGKRDSIWAYWKARALRETVKGRPEMVNTTPQSPTPTMVLRPELQEAVSLLEGIASPRGFYEILATEELGKKVALPVMPPALSATEKEAARLNPGLNRALYAIAIGLRSDGVREWNYTTNLHTRGGMSERELLAAADFACQREVWDRCINTSERTKEAFNADQRFPMPFREAVVKRSQEIKLDPAYVYGLIRQESRFIMDARSHVGASGLMQVMPATARWTANKIGLTGFTQAQLNDRDINIAIGTAYLKLVLDDFQGSSPLAAAAYNAGPGRPRVWRNGPIMEGAAWAENVPFAETRDYVKKVAANATIYGLILGGQPSLKARMGSIGPREGGLPEPNRDIP